MNKQIEQWKLMEQILPRVIRTWNQFKKVQQMEEDSEERQTLMDGIDVENAIYKAVSESLVGIDIKKGQVTFEEYGSLLYFTKVTGLKKEELFSSAFYPWIN